MTDPLARHPWTLRRRIGRSFAVLTAVVVLLLAAVIAATVEFVLAGNAVVYRWQPAITRTQRLVTDLVDQETGVRGYALTGDGKFLEPYNRFRIAERDDAGQLQALVGGDRVMAPKVAAVNRAAATWQRQIAEPAVKGIAAGDPNAVRLVESATAKRLFDQLRARAGELSGALSARTLHARDTRAVSGVVFVVALSLAMLVVVATGVLLWRGLHRWVLAPIDWLGEQTREVAGGDTYRQIVPGGPAELTDLGGDVEAMRLQIAGQLARAEEIQEELRIQGAELARSNDDLQQFAYVASHDLSEPLRKVANFCQLLERQYGPHLDDRAREYIGFAVDGAKRMQRLITDLLALSRVGRMTEQFDPVDLDDALDDALSNLGENIASSHARIERLTRLPTLAGDRSLLISLFENLVGNAVKYRRDDDPPVVRIDAHRDPAQGIWTFTVSDNGIGIQQQYAERIFVVFQRLHLRDRYGGTGIGLALCRKIVEFHGGRIWLAPVESTPGATFRFTLPEGGSLGGRSRD
jgi:signal transduction histidine kinase